MEYIRIRNLRSLVDTGEVQIKPITLLIGHNSSGKSTFLRTFPLLRQSVDARTTGPLLWYGQYVDFGNFRDALSRMAPDNNRAIEFEFRFPLHLRSFTDSDEREDVRADVILTLTVVEEAQQEATRVSECRIQFADTKIRLEFVSNRKLRRLVINGRDLSDNAKDLPVTSRVFLPIVGPEYRPFRVLSRPRDDKRRSPFASQIDDIIVSVVHRRTQREAINNIAERANLRIAESSEMLNFFRNLAPASNTWTQRTAQWTVSTPEFITLRDLIFANNLGTILSACDEHLWSFARSVRYSAPLRATAERYYRLQALAVDEVDAQGQNLAMVLRNLNDDQRQRFRTWTQQVFGFSVEAQAEGGHVSLTVKELDSSTHYNLADMGFGYSQILPVITQLWLLVEMSSRYASTRIAGPTRAAITYAIEQPELHLHPKYQAQLADAFVAVIGLARQRRIDLRLIIETHSETLVNRFGHHIAQDSFKPEDINLVLFEKPTPESATSVTFGSFDDEGYLMNWPYGFFEPDDLKQDS